MLKTIINITILSHNLKQRDKLLKAAIHDFRNEPLPASNIRRHILLSKDSDSNVKIDLEHFHTGRVETKTEKAKRKTSKMKPTPKPNGKAQISYKDLTK